MSRFRIHRCPSGSTFRHLPLGLIFAFRIPRNLGNAVSSFFTFPRAPRRVKSTFPLDSPIRKRGTSALCSPRSARSTSTNDLFFAGPVTAQPLFLLIHVPLHRPLPSFNLSAAARLISKASPALGLLPHPSGSSHRLPTRLRSPPRRCRLLPRRTLLPKPLHLPPLAALFASSSPELAHFLLPLRTSRRLRDASAAGRHLRWGGSSLRTGRGFSRLLGRTPRGDAHLRCRLRGAGPWGAWGRGLPVRASVGRSWGPCQSW